MCINNHLAMIEKDYCCNLVRFPESSFNSLFVGFSEKIADKIMVKHYNNVSNSYARFYREKTMYQQELTDKYVDHYMFDNDYYLVYRYSNFTKKKSYDAREVGKLLAHTHLMLAELDIELAEDSLLEKIQQKRAVLAQSRFQALLDPVFQQYDALLPQITAEIVQRGSAVIHGDFGFRNIVIEEGNLKLIDFERITYSDVWEDVVKLFYQNLKTMEQRASFIAGYQTVKAFDMPSNVLRGAIEFHTALGIYKYLLNNEDDEFEQVADTILSTVMDCLS